MSIAERYHQATKYAPETLADGPGLDWSRQPLAYKDYDCASPVALGTWLPLDPNPFTGAEADRELVVQVGNTMGGLSKLIFFAYGITAVAPGGARPLYLRAAPSAGGLYPAELYLVVRDWPDLVPGLYGYDPRRHALVPLWEGDDAAVAVAESCYGDAEIAGAPAALMVSAVFERSAWRYRERGYRRVLLDAGHLLGNAAIAAPALGLRLHATSAFHDRGLADLLRCEPTEEGVLAVAAIDAAGEARRPRWPALPSPAAVTGTAAGASDLHLAGALGAERPRLVARGEPQADELERRHGWQAGETLRGAGCAGPGPLAAEPLGTIMRRRSCRRFRPIGMARDAFARVLAAAYAPDRVGLGEQPGFDRGRLLTFIAVQGVDGIAPGVYYLAPHALELRLVRAGQANETVRFLALGQELAGAASAVIFHAADLARAVHEMGDRAYRTLHLDAGMIGQRLNLAAMAEGLGASGIGGFFDDQSNALLGIPGEYAIVYLTVLGVPG